MLRHNFGKAASVAASFRCSSALTCVAASATAARFFSTPLQQQQQQQCAVAPAPSLFSARRFCSSTGKHKTTPAAESKATPGAVALDDTAALMQRVTELDSKCSAWVLTKEDVGFALDTLRALSAAQKAGETVQALTAADVVPYVDPDEPDKGQHVPWLVSALYRAVVSYPRWYTLSGNSDPTNRGEHVIQLQRAGTPERSLYAAPFAAGSLPAGEETGTVAAAPGADGKKRDGRIFVLATDPDYVAPLAAELKSATGSSSTPQIAGYELFHLAQMLVAQEAATVTFGGISIRGGTDPNKVAVIGNEPGSARVLSTMCRDAALESSLVLVKWLVEESPQTQLRGHKALFVAQAIQNMLEHATYYALSDQNGASFLFTSMHHLLRYRDFAVNNAEQEWEARKPWKVGTCEGRALVWGDPARPVTINPAGPGDQNSTMFPCFNLTFSGAAIEQMQAIAAQMPKQQQK